MKVKMILLILILSFMFLSCNQTRLDLIKHETRFTSFILRAPWNTFPREVLERPWKERFPETEFLWIQSTIDTYIILPKEGLRRILNED